MTIFLTALVVSLWYLVGITGFVYWWTTEFDLTPDELPIMLFTGITGPVAWIGGYFIHRETKPPKPPTALVKKRKS